MRDIILKQEKYYTVFSNENILNDVVTINNITDINQDLLPKKGAYYQTTKKNRRLSCQSLEYLLEKMLKKQLI